MQESVLTGYGVVGFMYPGRDPARGRTVAQGSPAAQEALSLTKAMERLG